MAAPRDLPQVLRRRSAAVAAAALVLLVVIGLIAATGDDDGGEISDDPPPPSQALPEASKRIANERIGAAIRRPEGWSAKRGTRTLTLRSPDRATVISVSLPPGATRSAAVLSAAVDVLRREYSQAEVLPGDGRRLADLPTVSSVVRARNARGVPVRVLVASPQGSRRAWLVEVFAGNDSRGGAGLVEAQVALGTLRLSD